MNIKEFSKTRGRNGKGQFVVPLNPSGFDRKKYKKEYHLKHRASRIAKAVEWGRKNKERRKVIKDKWRAKNKERTNFLTRRYLYRRKNAVGSHSPEELNRLFDMFQGNCAYCIGGKATTVDHIVPLTKGGTNNIDNLVPCCRSCNSSKGNKFIGDWRPIMAHTLTRFYGTEKIYGIK